jgi:hypothetical protein
MKIVPLIQPAEARPDPALALAAIERFRRLISNGSWFAAVGAVMTPAEQSEAASYLAAIGRPDGTVRSVENWTEADRLVVADVWDEDWRQAEQRLRDQLYTASAARLGEARLGAVLGQVMEAASDAVHGATALKAARTAQAGQALLRIGAEAAAESSSDAVLALATGGSADHPFLTKHRLFAAGRWPLGLADGTFHLF